MWASFLKELSALIKRVGALFFAYVAGKKAANREHEKDSYEAREQSRETQDAKDREFKRRRNDDARRDELREWLETDPD